MGYPLGRPLPHIRYTLRLTSDFSLAFSNNQFCSLVYILLYRALFTDWLKYHNFFVTFFLTNEIYLYFYWQMREYNCRYNTQRRTKNRCICHRFFSNYTLKGKKEKRKRKRQFFRPISLKILCTCTLKEVVLMSLFLS